MQNERQLTSRYYLFILFGLLLGYHLWHSDLRPDDTPIEAGLAFTCRKTGDYIGKAAIDEQRKNGIRRKLAFFTMDAQVSKIIK